MESQKTQVQQETPKNKKLVLLASIVLIIIIIATGVYLFFNKFQTKIPNEIQSEVIEQTVVENWQTYQDTTLGIEVKYPANWIPRKTYSNDFFSVTTNNNKVEIINPGGEMGGFTRFSVSYGEGVIDFSKPGFAKVRLPNEMLAYQSPERSDQWGTGNLYYIQKGPYNYSLSFFIQSNKGGRDGFTQKELELENKIISSFKFVDPSSIKQSRLNTDLYRESVLNFIFLTLPLYFDEFGGFPSSIQELTSWIGDNQDLSFLTPPSPGGACTPQTNEYVYEPISSPKKVGNKMVYTDFKFTYCLEDAHGADELSAGLHVIDLAKMNSINQRLEGIPRGF
jgi:hypothetical protein